GREERLEVRRTAGAAVAGAAGGDALRLAAGDVRAAGVARLGADAGAGHAGDGALRVGDAGVELLDRAAVPAGGGAGAADRGADDGRGGAGDGHIAAAVAVDQGLGHPVGVGGDPGVVTAREGRALEAALGLLVDAGGGG